MAYWQPPQYNNWQYPPDPFPQHTVTTTTTTTTTTSNQPQPQPTYIQPQPAYGQPQPPYTHSQPTYFNQPQQQRTSAAQDCHNAIRIANLQILQDQQAEQLKCLAEQLKHQYEQSKLHADQLNQQAEQLSHLANDLAIHWLRFDTISKKPASLEQDTEAKNEQLQVWEGQNALGLNALRQDLADQLEDRLAIIQRSTHTAASPRLALLENTDIRTKIPEQLDEQLNEQLAKLRIELEKDK